MRSKVIRIKDNRRNKAESIILSTEQLDSLKKITQAIGKNSTGIIMYPNGAGFKNKDENYFIKLSSKLDTETKEVAVPKDDDGISNNKEVSIYTSNIVGVLKCNDVIVEVQSRFDANNNQYFFSTMLSHAFNCGFSKDFRPNVDSNGIWEIMLVLVFADSLEKAYQQGLFKQYVENKYNDYSFKGRLDVTRHLKSNIPFQGRIAWSNREYSYNNPIINLIHHTINTVSFRYYDIWMKIYSKNSHLPEIERVIREASPTYSWNTHYHLLQECNKPINHPLFSEYEPLRKICLMILREEGIKVYNADEDEVYGILFDCAWLWENFVFKRLLSKISFKKQEMQFKQPAMKALFINKNSPKYQPDFITVPESKGIVLDAKYKEAYEQKDSNEGENNDLYQAMSYQFLHDSVLTGLVFPTKEKPVEKKAPRKCSYEHISNKQFWYIPFWVGDTNIDSFYSDFENECNNWVECYTQAFEEILQFY
ncbi:MAG: hypothetical protein PHE26_07920 [Syntrophomonadaceae bacterium]|nr:hypothetical protein [Syntrophomonadaceae bacterium]